jgi:alkanesulfonate monooxygenase SsuD/methylene tetrahydromethanopterin reductase-like flavin-dependent oxidoreductase (luciferase family)
VLVLPLRNATIVAKESASLDALSGGKFTLGVGVGGREGDYAVTQTSFHDRGKRVDEQLARMKRIWAGEKLAENAGVIGPPVIQKGGPELLIGGYGPAMIRRVARWGDGYISGGGGTPPRLKELYPKIMQAWQKAGRPGKPRLVGGFYFGLGPHAAERMPVFIRDYYASLGPNVENMVKNIPTTPEAVERTIRGFAEVGMDELIFWPTFADLDQAERLAEVVNKLQ